MAKINCVDLSSWQSNVDFKTLKSVGIEGVILRVGFGNYTKDSQFENHFAGARNAKIKIGAYWYSKAHNVKEAIEEAKACIKLLNGRQLELPIYFDMEESYHTYQGLGRELLTRMAEAFCDTVISNGYMGGIYSNYSGFTCDLDYKKLKEKYSIWLAYYQLNPYYECDIWQNSCTGKVKGINGNVDTNIIFNLDKISKKSTKTNSNEKVQAQDLEIPSVTYRVRANGRWWNEITDLKDFAGVVGKPITDVAIKVSKGKLKYRVHNKGGQWLPYVTGYNIKDDENGYAGDKKPIDLIEIYYTTPADIKNKIGFLKAKYRVSSLNNNYYDWQYDNETSNGQDGYAGEKGKSIDRLQIILAK